MEFLPCRAVPWHGVGRSYEEESQEKDRALAEVAVKTSTLEESLHMVCGLRVLSCCHVVPCRFVAFSSCFIGDGRARRV